MWYVSSITYVPVGSAWKVPDVNLERYDLALTRIRHTVVTFKSSVSDERLVCEVSDKAGVMKLESAVKTLQPYGVVFDRVDNCLVFIAIDDLSLQFLSLVDDVFSIYDQARKLSLVRDRIKPVTTSIADEYCSLVRIQSATSPSIRTKIVPLFLACCLCDTVWHDDMLYLPDFRRGVDSYSDPVREFYCISFVDSQKAKVLIAKAVVSKYEPLDYSINSLSAG